MHAQENAACNQMNISPLIEYSRKHFFSSLVFSLNWISLQVKLDPSLLTAVIPHSRYNQSNYNKTQVFRATRCWTQSTSVTVNGVNINPPPQKKGRRKNEIQIKCHYSYFINRQEVHKQIAFFCHLLLNMDILCSVCSCCFASTFQLW